MVKNIPDGVYPTMVTPFTEDNKVDYNGVLELLNWYSEKGVDGLLFLHLNKQFRNQQGSLQNHKRALQIHIH